MNFEIIENQITLTLIVYVYYTKLVKKIIFVRLLLGRFKSSPKYLRKKIVKFSSNILNFYISRYGEISVSNTELFLSTLITQKLVENKIKFLFTPSLTVKKKKQLVKLRYSDTLSHTKLVPLCCDKFDLY